MINFFRKIVVKSVEKTKQQYNAQFQMSHQTRLNRFPKIFKTLKSLKSNPERILSFGCSTGEECETLAENYPSAKEIIGVDIDIYSIKTARSKNKRDNVFFLDDVGGTGCFDLVTSIMVLFSTYNAMDFKTFDKIVSRVSGHLNEGAIWAIYSSDHNILDSSVGNHYTAIKQWLRKCPKTDKKYYCGYYKFSHEKNKNTSR
jgi:SAM-dependent methyltransferase